MLKFGWPNLRLKLAFWRNMCLLVINIVDPSTDQKLSILQVAKENLTNTGLRDAFDYSWVHFGTVPNSTHTYIRQLKSC